MRRGFKAAAGAFEARQAKAIVCVAATDSVYTSISRSLFEFTSRSSRHDGSETVVERMRLVAAPALLQLGDQSWHGDSVQIPDERIAQACEGATPKVAVYSKKKHRHRDCPRKKGLLAQTSCWGGEEADWARRRTTTTLISPPHCLLLLRTPLAVGMHHSVTACMNS